MDASVVRGSPPELLSSDISLDHLTEAERDLILAVIQRDEQLRRKDYEQIERLKEDINKLVQLETLTALSSRDGAVRDTGKICARCHAEFGFFRNRGDVCLKCQKKVCDKCRHLVTTKENWLCTLCFKRAELQTWSGAWLHSKFRRSRRRIRDFGSSTKREDTPHPEARRQEINSLAESVASIIEVSAIVKNNNENNNNSALSKSTVSFKPNGSTILPSSTAVPTSAIPRRDAEASDTESAEEWPTNGSKSDARTPTNSRRESLLTSSSSAEAPGEDELEMLNDLLKTRVAVKSLGNGRTGGEFIGGTKVFQQRHFGARGGNNDDYEEGDMRSFWADDDMSGRSSTPDRIENRHMVSEESSFCSVDDELDGQMTPVEEVDDSCAIYRMKQNNDEAGSADESLALPFTSRSNDSNKNYNFLTQDFFSTTTASKNRQSNHEQSREPVTITAILPSHRTKPAAAKMTNEQMHFISNDAEKLENGHINYADGNSGLYKNNTLDFGNQDLASQLAARLSDADTYEEDLDRRFEQLACENLKEGVEEGYAKAKSQANVLDEDGEMDGDYTLSSRVSRLRDILLEDDEDSLSVISECTEPGSDLESQTSAQGPHRDPACSAAATRRHHHAAAADADFDRMFEAEVMNIKGNPSTTVRHEDDIDSEINAITSTNETFLARNQSGITNGKRALPVQSVSLPEIRVEKSPSPVQITKDIRVEENLLNPKANVMGRIHNQHRDVKDVEEDVEDEDEDEEEDETIYIMGPASHFQEGQSVDGSREEKTLTNFATNVIASNQAETGLTDSTLITCVNMQSENPETTNLESDHSLTNTIETKNRQDNDELVLRKDFPKTNEQSAVIIESPISTNDNVQFSENLNTHQPIEDSTEEPESEYEDIMKALYISPINIDQLEVVSDSDKHHMVPRMNDSLTASETTEKLVQTSPISTHTSDQTNMKGTTQDTEEPTVRLSSYESLYLGVDADKLKKDTAVLNNVGQSGGLILPEHNATQKSLENGELKTKGALLLQMEKHRPNTGISTVQNLRKDIPNEPSHILSREVLTVDIQNCTGHKKENEDSDGESSLEPVSPLTEEHLNLSTLSNKSPDNYNIVTSALASNKISVTADDEDDEDDEYEEDEEEGYDDVKTVVTQFEHSVLLENNAQIKASVIAMLNDDSSPIKNEIPYDEKQVSVSDGRGARELQNTDGPGELSDVVDGVASTPFSRNSEGNKHERNFEVSAAPLSADDFFSDDADFVLPPYDEKFLNSPEVIPMAASAEPDKTLVVEVHSSHSSLSSTSLTSPLSMKASQNLSSNTLTESDNCTAIQPTTNQQHLNNNNTTTTPVRTTESLPNIAASPGNRAEVPLTESYAIRGNGEEIRNDIAMRERELELDGAIMLRDGNRESERNDGVFDFRNSQESGVDYSTASLKSDRSAESSRITRLKANKAIGSQESLYSNMGRLSYAKIPVAGDVCFGLEYIPRTHLFVINVRQCRDIAPVDVKHGVSNPYVKTYLLPDKSASGKRKTHIVKNTTSPVFNEKLTYEMTLTELATRSLWLSVWHSGRLGRNEFLGDVTLPLNDQTFADTTPQWYKLQQQGAVENWKSLLSLTSHGELDVAIKRVQLKQREELHVTIRQARNLTRAKSAQHANTFCKCRLLPDMSTHKTPVIKHDMKPSWNHTSVFLGISSGEDLLKRSLEITVWEHGGHLKSSDFLGGIRLNIGTGFVGNSPASWMDGSKEEVSTWQNVLEHPNEWIVQTLPLRIDMNSQL